METSYLEWQAFEHHHDEKNSDWYWAIGIVAVSMAATAIIVHNVIFGLFILVAATALSIHAARPPRLITMGVDDEGIIVGNIKYPYTSLEAFWVHKQEHRLLLHSKRSLAPLIVLELGDADAQTVREALAPRLAEQQLQEPLLQKVMEYLGF